MTKATEESASTQGNDNSSWWLNTYIYLLTAFNRTPTATAITTDTPEPDTRIQIIGKLPEELLSSLLGNFLSLDEKRALAELPVKNPTAELKHISNTFKDRLTHIDKPKALTDKLLKHVARGEQDEADKLLMDYGQFQDVSRLTFKSLQTVLLQRTGDITDYSGRTFKNITAYEYAYWAKDTHMCRMLEKHMDDDTKADLLKRCEAIEKNGLTYEQHGHVVKNSKHFDMTPLIMAYNEYIQAHHNWANHMGTNATIVSAWMAVGMAQRNVPVHVINEYFRTDRSFHPLPEFKFVGDILPREIKHYDRRARKMVALFPLVVSESVGLGVDFAFARRAYSRVLRGERGPPADFAGIDLAAISRLDVVRTQELKQSLEFLRKPKEPERGIGLR